MLTARKSLQTVQQSWSWCCLFPHFLLSCIIFPSEMVCLTGHGLTVFIRFNTDLHLHEVLTTPWVLILNSSYRSATPLQRRPSPFCLISGAQWSRNRLLHEQSQQNAPTRAMCAHDLRPVSAVHDAAPRIAWRCSGNATRAEGCFCCGD